MSNNSTAVSSAIEAGYLDIAHELLCYSEQNFYPGLFSRPYLLALYQAIMKRIETPGNSEQHTKLDRIINKLCIPEIDPFLTLDGNISVGLLAFEYNLPDLIQRFTAEKKAPNLLLIKLRN